VSQRGYDVVAFVNRIGTGAELVDREMNTPE